MKATSLSAIILLLMLSLFLFNACVSDTAVSEPVQDPAPAPVNEASEPEPVSEEPAVEEPAEPEPAETPASDNEYEMDEEEYEITKRDLSELVQELNKIISSQRYEEWQNYLTQDYIDHYSDPGVLKEYSESPTLSKYNIRLRTLKDYFNYVVVASRRDVRIDDINAISENKVKAYMIVNNEPIVVYTLEKIDDRWKITR